MKKDKSRDLKSIAVKFGLYKGIRWLWHRVNPELHRLEKEHRREYLDFRNQCGEIFEKSLLREQNGSKRALVVSTGYSGVKIELGLIKSLEMAGYQPIVLTDRDPWLVKYYQLAGVQQIRFWDQYVSKIDPTDSMAWFDDCQTLDDLLRFEWAGARVGKYTASTALRYLRLGELNLHLQEIRQPVSQYFCSAVEYAESAQKIVKDIRPKIALTLDPGYTPRGELYDACMAAGVDSITWNAAHKSNTLMLKRYSNNNRDVHPSSLSDETWQQIMKIEWNESLSQQLHQELFRTYASGDWYSEVGTQFNTRIVEKADLTHRLGLNPQKKTAIIFPHIFWDGTFFWGTDLFDSYEEWFLETVRVACNNKEVNWVIKVHPANLVKNKRDGVQGEPSEVTAIREKIGDLPANMFIIHADSKINTYSLFKLMDYCVTVRGTVGIEAASYGVSVITAGTGRYNGKGFTLDSQTREEYLSRIKSIHTLSSMTLEQRELAERFAFGVFLLRPLDLDTIKLEFQQNSKASSMIYFERNTSNDLSSAKDLKAIAEYIVSGQEDFANHGKIRIDSFNSEKI